jgi:hypothetical protein
MLNNTEKPKNSINNNSINNNFYLGLDLDIPLTIPKKAVENNENIKKLLSIAEIIKIKDNGILINAELYIALEQAITKKLNELNEDVDIEKELRNNPIEKSSDYIYYRLSLFYSVVDHIINKSFNINKIYRNLDNNVKKDDNVEKDGDKILYNNIFTYVENAISSAIKEFDNLLNNTKENIIKSKNLSSFNNVLLKYAEEMNRITKELFNKAEKIKYPI